MTGPLGTVSGELLCYCLVDLSRRLFRRMHIFAVLVALLLAAQPLLHNHPLDAGSDVATSAPSTCAVCAAGIGRLPSTAPALSAPLLILYTIAAAPLAAVVAIAPFASGSRAPPAA